MAIHFGLRDMRRGFMFLLKCLLIALVTGLFYFAYNYHLDEIFYSKGYLMGLFAYILLFIVLAEPYELFRIGVLRKRELQFSLPLVLLSTNFIAYLIIALISRRLISPLPLLLCSLVQTLLGWVYYHFANYCYFRLYPARDTVIVYSLHKWDQHVMQKFARMKERYIISAIFKETDPMEEIEAAILKHGTCIIGRLPSDERSHLIDFCYRHNKRIFVMPSLDDILLHHAHHTQIGDSLVYLIKNRPLSLEQLALKRLFDLLLSGLILLLSSPVLLISAIIIKCTDGGPIFFRQDRVTRGEHVFSILKFRSMIVDAEKHGAQLTTEHDPRITPIGRFLRKTRIDEIPQLINVLKGEMSIVGPRAERIENHQYYSEHMPSFRYRTKVKAGITGYAQIFGKYNTSFEDKVRMDLHYVQNYSLRSDFALLFATLRVLIKSDATEGFEMTQLDFNDTEDQD